MIALVGAISAGVWYWVRDNEDKTPHELTLYGNVDIREVELPFEVSGRIEKVLVDEGNRIHQGQLLATLELQQFQYQVARAKASLAAQQQVVAELEAGTRPEEIRRSRAQVSAAEAHVYEARQHFARTQKLAPEGATSREENDEARAAYEASEADLRVSQASLDLALAGPRIQEIEAARAKQALNEAELDLANWSLSKTDLIAPSSGVVRQRILEPGAMAAPDRPVFTVALDDPLWVRVYASEPDLGRIQLGMSADVHTDSFPDTIYKGWVGYISPVAEFTPKSVQTEQLRRAYVQQESVTRSCCGACCAR